MAVPVEWLVDTGADIASVRAVVGAAFDVTICPGLSAGSTTGGGGFQVVLDIGATFEVEAPGGATRTARGDGYVAIKSGNTGSNVLGMQQLADAGASLVWDPRARTGTLRG